LTSKPFGVNITLLPTINPPDYEGYARAAVAEGVTIFETAGNNRKWKSNLAIERAQTSTAGPLIKYFKDSGCIVIHKCTTIRHAKVRPLASGRVCLTSVLTQSAERMGVDVLSIDGFECTSSLAYATFDATDPSRCWPPRRRRHWRPRLGKLANACQSIV
jgi:hypothetical protein